LIGLHVFCSVTDAANNLCDPPLISYFEFYNSSLDSLDLLAEYCTWQNPPTHGQLPVPRSLQWTFFCAYPLLRWSVNCCNGL